MSELPHSLTMEESAALAAAAADDFMLPQIWQLGRQPSDGLIIDESSYVAAEDAVNITLGDEADVLHVSAADPGSFLYDIPAIAGHARRQTRTIYLRHDGEETAHHMVPPRLSKDKLALAANRARPAITAHIPVNANGIAGEASLTRDVLRARKITQSAIEIRMTGTDEAAFTLRGLYIAAHGLRIARLGKHAAETNQHPAYLIVGESMIAAGQAIGAYAQQNNIPILYRNQVVPPDLAAMVPANKRAKLSGAAETFWSTTPEGMLSLGVPIFAPFTSPLREFPDFVNSCNLAAHLEGRPFPYPNAQLAEIARSLNQQAAEQGLQRLRRITERSWERGSFGAISLLRRLEQGRATPRDLTVSLFAAEGRPADLQRLRQAAAQFMAAQPHLVRRVIAMAMARDLLAPQEQIRTNDTDPLLFADARGNTYHYDPSIPGRWTDGITFIGRVAGTEGLTFIPTSNTPSKKSAALPSTPMPDTKRRQLENPIVQLQARMQTAGGQPVEYSTQETPEGIFCVAKVIDVDGTLYEERVLGRGKTAKRRAAAALLAKMPPRPLSKREAAKRQRFSP